ncbi:hypothetical protein TAMC210_02840 [Thermanaeromonas sp. C210]|nr:hypothetical protein TAMC210_02840 [Thermanaeromonas sp. C210]
MSKKTKPPKTGFQPSQAKALRECSGIFSPGEYPEFKDQESIEAGVRSLRREVDKRLAQWLKER